MPIREILQLGNPLLLQKSDRVDDYSSIELASLIHDLSDTLATFRKAHGYGRGIAAVQIGVLKRVIFIRMQPTGFCSALINPTITWASTEKMELWDDCFSFPDFMVKVERAAHIRVEYFDAKGQPQKVEAEGDLSELLQHEIDHLDGVLAIHRAVSPSAFATRSEWQRQRQQKQEEVDMLFDLDQAIELLQRTPHVLKSWLDGLSDGWSMSNYGEETFSPFDVVGHLIHGEQTDWMVRAHIILEQGQSHPFPPFDRYAMYEASRGKSLAELLTTFAQLREKNLNDLRAFKLTPEKLESRGTHPVLGTVTLKQLLATWVVHDLNHLHQIAKAMAYQYRHGVGPWREYIPFLPREEKH